MRIVITGSEAPPPFGDPLGGLKINDLTLILVQNREKKSSSELLFFTIVAILSPSTTVNTINHHNAKST
jgi:hypothetical protein